MAWEGAFKMIILKDICKKYGNLTVLDNFSLAIPKGKITCMLGASGTGKTTLLRILMGLEAQDSGTINGNENATISAVFQEDRLCENLDVYANIMLPHIYKKGATPLTKDRIDFCIAQVGLEGLGGKTVSELSGGMKRRTAILRALLANYDILFLDEPFKGLDDETKQKTIQFTLSETRQKTVIYITHDNAELEHMKPDVIINLDDLI